MNKKLSLFLMLLLKVVAFTTICVVVFVFFINILQAKDNSMAPSVCVGDIVIVSKMQNKYDAGSVVMYKTDGKEYILRIGAVAGNVIDVLNDGTLLINGYPAGTGVYDTTEQQKYPYTVPQGYVYLLGDNAEKAIDSRDFGAVNKEDITGTIITMIRRRDI